MGIEQTSLNGLMNYEEFINHTYWIGWPSNKVLLFDREPGPDAKGIRTYTLQEAQEIAEKLKNESN